MTLQNIAEKLEGLNVYETRCVDEEKVDIAFFAADVKEWEAVLSGILGEVMKPAGVKPTKEQIKELESYGGIWAGQTLFKKCGEGSTILAMFWPWDDGEHITLKMYKKETREESMEDEGEAGTEKKNCSNSTRSVSGSTFIARMESKLFVGIGLGVLLVTVLANLTWWFLVMGISLMTPGVVKIIRNRLG